MHYSSTLLYHLHARLFDVVMMVYYWQAVEPIVLLPRGTQPVADRLSVTIV